METQNLRIIPCGKQLLELAIQGNTQLAMHLQVTVPENWTEFGLAPLQYALHRLTENNNETGWWTYLPVHKADKKLIGSCGYKGKPGADAVVEIGYEIAGDYRNKGLATEVVNALVAHAFLNKQVDVVIAHTLAEYNASVSVLTKCGFIKTDEINDPDDGRIWKWELGREANRHNSV